MTEAGERDRDIRARGEGDTGDRFGRASGSREVDLDAVLPWQDRIDPEVQCRSGVSKREIDRRREVDDVRRVTVSARTRRGRLYVARRRKLGQECSPQDHHECQGDL